MAIEDEPMLELQVNPIGGKVVAWGQLGMPLLDLGPQEINVIGLEGTSQGRNLKI
jgi:hypothetical protein